MEINIKTYEYEKVEKLNTKFELPDKTSYYFETNIRRSIRIEPIWTTWNQEQYNKPEEIYKYHFTMIYLSGNNRLEMFSVPVSNFEYIYNSEIEVTKFHIVKSLLNGWLDERTEEQFNTDLTNFLNKIPK